MNSTVAFVKDEDTANGVGLQTERMSEDTPATSSAVPCAEPSSTVNSYGKRLMRGSKPGRCSPAAGLTLVESMSVIVPTPPTVPTLETVPLGTGWLVSPGSSSGLLRKRSG